MKTKYFAITILIFAISLFVSRAYAQNSLASGYRITTDHHGTNVILGEKVTAWADTTDLTTDKVLFAWKWEDGEAIMRTFENETFDVWYTYGVPGVEDGTPVRRFTDSYAPDIIGNWSVKATFINAFGQTPASENDSFPVRATSFHVIPEVPLGTIAIILTMFASMGFFTIRKRKTTIQT